MLMIAQTRRTENVPGRYCALHPCSPRIHLVVQAFVIRWTPLNLDMKVLFTFLECHVVRLAYY